MDPFQIGDIVQTNYNSGTYIGQVIEERGNFLLVEVMAVLKHPEQGDLHNRGQVEGVAFHERKALAYREKFNARKRTTMPYDGDVPSYEKSLKKAIHDFEKKLTEDDTPFNRLSLDRLNDLKKHYYHKIL